jgi:hypothetical protein
MADLPKSDFRQGRRVPRNVYYGDEPLFMAATDELAAELVLILNAGAASLRSATGDGREAKEPHDYEVIGTTYDGVKVLRAISEPTNFTRDEIRAAVEAALQPRSTKIEGAGDNA